MVPVVVGALGACLVCAFHCVAVDKNFEADFWSAAKIHSFILGRSHPHATWQWKSLEVVVM